MMESIKRGIQASLGSIKPAGKPKKNRAAKKVYQAPDQFAKGKPGGKLKLIPRPDKLQPPVTREELAGPILKENICLKLDRFHNIAGDLPAFREIGGIHGCAQPSLKGIEQALQELGAPEGRQIVWTNLRAEPVLYIKGQPYSPKDKNSSENNFEYPQMSLKEIEGMEKRFKQEVLDKLEKGEKLDFCFPQEKGGYCLLDQPRPQEIKTMTEVYREWEKKYPNLDFTRIAINDRMRPRDKDFDKLVERFKNSDPKARYITNCMGGWGRTTTAMTVFDIMRTAENSPQADLTEIPALRREISESGKGNFGALRTMLTAGKAAEFTVDHFIIKENASDFQAVIDEQGKAGCHMLREVSWGVKNNPKRVKDFLDRYLYLAVFYQYCKEEAPHHYQQPFSQWIKPHRRKMEISSQALVKLFKLEGAVKG